MPRNNEKTYCLNHPDLELVVLNEKNTDTFHAIRLATLEYGKRVKMESKSTGFDVYACPECGYSELYLTPSELKLIRKDP